ncbi:flagellar export chaperone FlgN [Iocasia frigidifontis]|uniref:flagellar export chaperone FlgN n=1 Tax=Iocasia fonsfrigidae TaxID=2682810 RepID=UPI001E40D1C0|nr:flagellar export chaperone FlgN [Iocasia fonsfrigidae]
MGEEVIERLIEILEEEYEYLVVLNQLVLKKKKAIIKNDVDKLAELLGKDREILAGIQSLEKDRLEIISQLKEMYKLNKEDLTFVELKDSLPDLWQKELSVMKEKMLKVIADLHKGNEKNRVLIAEAVKLNEFSLGILLNILQPTNQTYDKKVGLGTKVSQHILDQRS